MRFMVQDGEPKINNFSPEIIEIRKNIALSEAFILPQTENDLDIQGTLLHKYESLNKILRITHRCLTVIRNIDTHKYTKYANYGNNAQFSQWCRDQDKEQKEEQIPDKKEENKNMMKESFLLTTDVNFKDNIYIKTSNNTTKMA